MAAPMIAPETIAAVRERTDIVALIGENVRLQKKGRRWLGLCPFHQEKTPSFSVSQERGAFYCFGCKESGSAIDYLMKLEGHSFVEAVRALAERAGIEVAEVGGGPADKSDRERRRRATDELFATNQLVATFFQRQLIEGGHPLAHHARDELVRRGLGQGSTEQVDAALKAFRVGYAPYGWDGLVRFLRQQEVSPVPAERLGLVVARPSGDGHYDAFRHRLMFAVLDRVGRVVAFSGRALPEPSEHELQRAGLPPMTRPEAADSHRAPPKYINSPESPIYRKGETVFGLHQARHAMRSRGQAVLVEGNFDVLALHARGLDRVAAPLGTAFTLPQAKALKRYAPELVVLFDGDEAGRKAAAALRGPAGEAGLRVRVARAPAGSDPDELAREKGVGAVEALIKGARGMIEHLIDEAIGTDAVWDGSRQQTLERIRQVVGYLAEERDPALRTMAKTYADEVASKLVIGGRAPTDLRALERMVARALAPAVDDPSGQEGAYELDEEREIRGPRARSRPRPREIELAVLGAVLDYPALLDEAAVGVALELCSGDTALALAAVHDAWEQKKSLHVAQLLDFMPQAVHAFAVGRLAAPLFSDVMAARRELLENAEKLRRRALTGDKVLKEQQLAQAQVSGDEDAEDELLREIDRVARSKRGLQ